MKIDIAVYTAQNGYSWQKGTNISIQRLKEYKGCIGKFPTPGEEDFPFGGIFLSEDSVVFYRYHIAKKIDFMGRDALYCVLGVVPKAEAARVDPKVLFSLPEFAGVMIPFPTEADVSAAFSDNAPEWLKNLENMSLDVRISGSLDNLNFIVKLEQNKICMHTEAGNPKLNSDQRVSAVAMPRSDYADGDFRPGDSLCESCDEDKRQSSSRQNRIRLKDKKKRGLWYKNPRIIICGLILLLLALAAFVIYAKIRGVERKPDKPAEMAEITGTPEKSEPQAVDDVKKTTPVVPGKKDEPNAGDLPEKGRIQDGGAVKPIAGNQDKADVPNPVPGEKRKKSSTGKASKKSANPAGEEADGAALGQDKKPEAKKKSNPVARQGKSNRRKESK